MKVKLRLWAKITLPLLILGLGVVGFKRLKSLKQKPKLRPPVEQAMPVTTILPQPTTRSVGIKALGKLVPARSLALQAEIAGRATFVSPQLVPGGLFKAKDEMLRVDQRDYRLAIRQRKAQLASAQVVLQQEESRQAVAKREWKILGTQVSGSDRGKRLALREPQIMSAKAGIDAAKSSLAAAQIALERTTISAPFNAIVRSENIEVGQRVGPGQPIATLVGTDHWWVQVAVPMSALKWLEIPGSKASVTHPGAPDTEKSRAGRVLRLLPEVDSGTQMAKILIEVPDPLGLAGTGSPLLLGSTVQVRLEGKTIESVHSIPRKVLRRNQEVWLVDAQEQLVTRPVEVVWRESDSLLVKGLNNEDRVISSALAGGTPGMKVRLLKPKAVKLHANKDSKASSAEATQQDTKETTGKKGSAR